jgi:Zn-dependent alcohol dehydrogenase
MRAITVFPGQPHSARLDDIAAPAVVAQVLGHTAPTGIVCLAGVSTPGRMIDLDIGEVNRALVLDNGAVFGSVNANRCHYDAAARSLARADKGWLSRLITRRVALEDWEGALRRRPDDVKAVIDFAA